jgi:hypothetical protein
VRNPKTGQQLKADLDSLQLTSARAVADWTDAIYADESLDFSGPRKRFLSEIGHLSKQGKSS